MPARGSSYVGKVIEDGLTTDRVDDVRRNVLSIVRRLCPDTRLPDVTGDPGLPARPPRPRRPEEEKPSDEGF